MSSNAGHISIGMNLRVFPNNWRPALQEIDFAKACGFTAIQVSTRDTPVTEAMLGAPLDVIGHALVEARLEPTMEIMLHLDKPSPTPLAVLEANLPAIIAMGCTCVHVHPIALSIIDQPETLRRLEQALVPSLAEAVKIAAQHGFKFGFEHNEAGHPIFHTPEVCRATLDAVPGLHFVWDFNHTAPEDLAAFEALIPRMSQLHVSDTPLPEVNHHLPLGLGNIDFAAYCQTLIERGFNGPAILEIGGLPKSGGYGRDTDEALTDSLRRLQAAMP